MAGGKAKARSAGSSSVRIIGGEHRGRKLSFRDHNGDLRPTGDRLRETLFNWLQFDLPNRRVLDLFAGSGALAAEALSRGAVSATLLELKKDRAEDLSRQLHSLFAGRVQVQCADAMAWLQQCTGTTFDLVFVDPPYHTELQTPACELLGAKGLLSPGALVYVESAARKPAPAVPAHWQLLKDKTGPEVRAQLFQLPDHGSQADDSP